MRIDIYESDGKKGKPSASLIWDGKSLGIRGDDGLASLVLRGIDEKDPGQVEAALLSAPARITGTTVTTTITDLGESVDGIIARVKKEKSKGWMHGYYLNTALEVLGMLKVREGKEKGGKGSGWFGPPRGTHGRGSQSGGRATGWEEDFEEQFNWVQDQERKVTYEWTDARRRRGRAAFDPERMKRWPQNLPMPKVNTPAGMRTSPALQTCRSREKALVGNGYETGEFVGPDGKVQWSLRGDGTYVEIPGTVIQSVLAQPPQTVIFTHNHPTHENGTVGLSPGDMTVASMANLAEIRSVDQRTGIRSSMRPNPQKGWPSPFNYGLVEAMRGAEVRAEAQKAVNSGAMTIETAQPWMGQEMMRRVAADFGLIFEMEKLQ